MTVSVASPELAGRVDVRLPAERRIRRRSRRPGHPFLQKPIPPELLVQTVSDALAQVTSG